MENNGWNGKTGLSLLLLAAGFAVMYFMPEREQLAMGIITAALAGLGIGVGHKAIKGRV